MKILIAFFSRTGRTETLMKQIRSNMETRGVSIEWEEIKTAGASSRFAELKKDLHNYPTVFIGLFKSAWRDRFTATYTQTEEDILPLRFPDVSRFDRIIIGGPKWARISYPVARYIHTVKGLAGKEVGSVSTFGGPPLPVFELELIEQSMNRILAEAGASVCFACSAEFVSHGRQGISPSVPNMPDHCSNLSATFWKNSDPGSRKTTSGTWNTPGSSITTIPR